MPTSPMLDRGSDVLSSAVRWSRWLAIATLVLGGGLALAGPHVASSVVLLAAGLGFLVGIPHGAVDHLLVARMAGSRPGVLILGAYAALAIGTWALIRWTGPVALLIVLTLSAVHFGLGELEVSRQLTGWRPGAAVTAAFIIAGCGALMLSIARAGDDLGAVALGVSPALADAVRATPVRIALTTLWLVAATVVIVAALRRRHPGVAIDIVLIGALGMVAPPILAFAAWFGGWHAVRHTARLMTVEPGCKDLLATRRPSAALARLARLAAWPSIAVFTVIAASLWWTAVAPDSATAMAQVLVVLLALTVPHMVVVLWMDARAH